MKTSFKIPTLFAMSATLCAAFFCVSCSTSGDDGTADGGGAGTAISLLSHGQVYTAGYSTGAMKAYYWVDGELQTIADAGDNSRAADVVPTNLGDYAVGVRQVFDDPVFYHRAIIWFNGNGQFLDDVQSFAYGAALHNGKIYAAGWRDPDGSGDRPCVWEIADVWTLTDGAYAVGSRTITRHDLDIAGEFGQARDIFSDGSDLYICGYYTEEITDFACYWKNYARVDLDGGTRAESITARAGGVYVGGRSSLHARYWIDGTGHDITGFPSGSSDDIVTAVVMGDDGLYVAGQYYKNDYMGFSWHDGTLTVSLQPVVGAGFAGTDFYLGFEEGSVKNDDDYTELEWIPGSVNPLRPRGVKMRLY